jgi:hypothetical protein
MMKAHTIMVVEDEALEEVATADEALEEVATADEAVTAGEVKIMQRQLPQPLVIPL